MSLSYAQLAIVGGQNSEGVQTNVTSGPTHGAESVPKLYSNPGMLGFLTHARTVSTRLSPPPPPESLDTRLPYQIMAIYDKLYDVQVHIP